MQNTKIVQQNRCRNHINYYSGNTEIFHTHGAKRDFQKSVQNVNYRICGRLNNTSGSLSSLF